MEQSPTRLFPNVKTCPLRYSGITLHAFFVSENNVVPNDSLSYHYSQSGDSNVAKAFEYSKLSIESLCRGEVFEVILHYVEAARKCAVNKSDKRTLKRILEEVQEKVRAKISQDDDGPRTSHLLTTIDDHLSDILHAYDLSIFAFRPLVSFLTSIRSTMSLNKRRQIHAEP